MRRTQSNAASSACGPALHLMILACLLLPPSPALAGADEKAGDDGVKEFESLQAAFKLKRQEFNAKSQSTPPEDQQKLFEEVYPGNVLAHDFFELEMAHRGTLVGISCLHHLVSQGGGVSKSDAPMSTGKRDAMIILRDFYTDHPDLDLILTWIRPGARYDEAASLLERATKSPHRYVRGEAWFALAQFHAAGARVPLMLDGWTELMSDADKDMREYQYLQEMKPDWKNHDPEKSRRSALEAIETVLSDYSDVLAPPGSSYGPILLNSVSKNRNGNNSTFPRPTLAEQAGELKYELTHLMIGQPAPEIDEPDAFGNPLRLSDRRGKAVMLFFSYKGCGPCEEMYPGNRKLVEEMQGRPFSLLGVMGDATIGTVKDAVESRKITWPVWWARKDRQLSNAWNVHGWPEIYLLDHEGKIRYRSLRGELLRRAVRRLVADAQKAQTDAEKSPKSK